MKEPIKPKYFTSADEIILNEKTGLGIERDEKVFGLALSGGGIRSASFGLGVLQALVGKDHLKRFHYMSTVSGGGYLGSALTYALSKLKAGQSGTSPIDFPLGKKKCCKPEFRTRKPTPGFYPSAWQLSGAQRRNGSSFFCCCGFQRNLSVFTSLLQLHGCF